VITFKIAKYLYPIPTCWSDVTYRQYLALLDSKSLTDQIHIFTGIPKETLETAELKNLEKITLALSFLYIAPKFERTQLVGPYTLPMDITIQSTGQMESLKRLLPQLKDPAQEPVKFADACLTACAIYCQKIKDGKYDFDKVPDVKEELKDYSCAEVIGTGAFFLARPWSLSTPLMSPYQSFILRLKNMSRALPIFQKILGSLQRFLGLAAK
jgi:hypothetical protein